MLRFTRITRRFSTSPKAIIAECQEIRKSVQSLNDKFNGPLSKSSQMNTVMPFVFLLGNHSSGKSSFVNFILQKKVQSTGVAPTDDSFTIIAPGPADVDRDGPSFIGDPDMGFNSLRNFGPTLVHHTQLKIRSDTAVKDFMIIDSPGMIDSPRSVKSQDHSTQASEHHQRIVERGYDFEKVCQWYADRADVILLFFDPDKPGTTGETLTVLTNSLAGLEHKLHIILNKADQFDKIHDFARSYGSLCWNLSKVILRKDLPRIYTMCLPNKLDDNKPLSKSLIDLDINREEVVKEVLNAPKRRVNNEITRLADAVNVLNMHCKVMNEVIQSYRSLKYKLYFANIGVLSVAVSIPVGGLFYALPVNITVLTSCIGLSSAIIMGWYTIHSLKDRGKYLLSTNFLNSLYQRLYSKQISNQNEFIDSLWKRVQSHIEVTVSPQDLSNLKKLSSKDANLLENILANEIPKLHRQIAPALHDVESTSALPGNVSMDR